MSTSGTVQTGYSRGTHMYQAARPPPRLRPPMIILVVLAIGVLFIGLTMTIIAHWPGYSAVGGNPLEIAGPCVLAVGGVVLIIAIVNILWNNSVANERRQEARTNLNMSKQSLVPRHTPNMHGARPAGQHPQPHQGPAPPGKGPASDFSGPIHNSSGTSSDYHGNPYRVSSDPMPGQKPPTQPKPIYSNLGYTRESPVAESSPDGGGYQPRRQMQEYGTGGYDAYEPGSLRNGYRPSSQTSLTGSGAGMGAAGRLNTSFEGDDYQVRSPAGVALHMPAGQYQQQPRSQAQYQQQQRPIPTNQMAPGTHSYRPPSASGSHTDTEV